MKILKRQIAGVIVLYNPDNSVIDNIQSYITDIDYLFIVDNSEEKNEHLALILNQTFQDIEYIFNHGNLGIATALNIGADRALIRGYSWLLTMDQDSKAGAQMVMQMANYISLDNVGLLTPQHIDIGIGQVKTTSATTEVLTTMTSGNLLNLKAYEKVGRFDEKLFIDYVDHEYCLRLKENGFKVTQVNSSILYHSRGQIKIHPFFFKKVIVPHYNCIRIYYITRNRFYVAGLYKKKFPEFYCNDIRFFWIDLFKIILFEKNLLQKLKSIVKGYIHFRKKRFGRL